MTDSGLPFRPETIVAIEAVKRGLTIARCGGGYGRRLMAALEQAARERGCRYAHLDTFSWQARPFYEELGYEVFAVLDAYPPGQQRFFMKKALA